MWSVVTLAHSRDLQNQKRWSGGAFSITYVEISGHERRTVWRRSKLENKVWHSGHYRHIALLKRTQKQVKIRNSVYIYITTRIHSERVLAVFPEVWYMERDELALLSANLFPSLMMLRCNGPQWFSATKSTFPCDHQNQLNKPSLMHYVIWMCKFSLVIWPVSRNQTTLNLFKCLPDLWKAPDFSFGMPGRRIESYEVLPAIQRNPRIQVIFVSFWSFWPRHEKLKQLLVCSKHPNTLGNIGNTVKILVATKSTRENVRQWKKARLTGDVFEFFGIKVVVDYMSKIFAISQEWQLLFN